ncbi:TetR/AcrR family transcriptional regulator [Paracoccus sp. (in: a-proteobacteria)]|uniref:TetR/AcrR family transcriptional regulator n=1 Tax=Paracoccus sp. TaxID=267 RepID=UPI00289C1451|nr:TetR/AcrR family transcriptional regulator [Paracoccus sp. (in: a-proteobacteria)]
MTKSAMPKSKSGRELPLRRSQEERSATTRRRVCQATLEALAEVGHERISTTMVAQKAKVSRGAISHQFPARNDLLVAALRQLHDDWEVGDPVAIDPEKRRFTLADLTQALWENVFSDKRYIASIELMLAARLDNDLGRRLREEMKRWVDIRDHRMALLLGFEPGSPEETLQLHLSLSVLRGIAVHQSFDQHQSLGPQLVGLWQTILGRAFPAQ